MLTELPATNPKGKQPVADYMEQTAHATPHAQLYYTSPTIEQTFKVMAVWAVRHENDECCMRNED